MLIPPEKVTLPSIINSFLWSLLFSITPEIGFNLLNTTHFIPRDSSSLQ